MLSTIWFVLSLYLLSQALLLTFGKRILVMPMLSFGGSMEPALPSGWLVSIDHYPLYVREGDIVTFVADDGSMVEHRVVGICCDGYILQGDANSVTDGCIPAKRIVSKHLTINGNLMWLPCSPHAARVWWGRVVNTVRNL